MACKRSIIARSKLFYQQQQPQRFAPSISHFSTSSSSSSDREELPAKTFSRNSEFPSRFMRYNAANSLLLSGNLSRLTPPKIPAGYGLGFHRNFSIKVIDGGDLIGEVGNKAVEAAAPVVNEVAVAAADSFAPVAAFQYLIDYVHCSTGYLWWESIAATALLINFIRLPFVIEQMKLVQTYRDISRVLKAELKELKSRNEPTDPRSEELKSLSVYYSKRSFGLDILPLTAMGISFFAISNMALKVPSFVTGGTSWFMDLTTPDHSMGLPILLTLTLWLRMKLDPLRVVKKKKHTGKSNFNLAVLASICTAVPLSAALPSAIYCYWIASNLTAAAFGIVLADPLVLKLLGISTKPPSTHK